MPTAPRRLPGAGRAFTLIELLTVIAIIAVLTAILFPVFAQVRNQGRKTACQSNLKQIVQAVQMYKDDWRVFPDALYGIQYGAASQTNVFATRLFPDYVKDQGVFTCPNHPQQLKTDNTLVNPINRMTGNPHMMPPNIPIFFARRSSYDFQYRPATPAGQTELHYTLKWTARTGLGDDPRQLIYREPPDNTVVTWCLYHTDMDPQGAVRTGGQANVAFVSGRVQPIPAEKVAVWSGNCTGGNPPTDCPWQVAPKP